MLELALGALEVKTAIRRGCSSARSVGRGSSVGSIVCYLAEALYVDPVENDLSLGRFINYELTSVPDIDLDFPRDIREELIVRVTERYGQEHAARRELRDVPLAGAIRDVGKALGLPHAELERLARVTDGWNAHGVAEEVGRLPDAEQKLLSKRWRAFQFLTGEIAGLPRHVSQRLAGWSSRRGRSSARPRPAGRDGRPAALPVGQGLLLRRDFLKIDLLGLGMLSCIEECVDQIARLHGAPIDLSRIPLDDEEVFAEIQAADTVGVFRSSRAQIWALLAAGDGQQPHHRSRARAAWPDPGEGRHPYIEHRRRLRESPRSSIPSSTSCFASRSPRRSGSSSSRTRCSTSRSRSRASRSARRRGCGGR